MWRVGRTETLVPSHVKLQWSIILRREYVGLLFGCCVNMVGMSGECWTKPGVVKTHQLTYSPTQSLYAVADKSLCTQHFVIRSKIAKEYLDHFQSRIEELDIYLDGDKLIWNGFTEGFIGDDNRTRTVMRLSI